MSLYGTLACNSFDFISIYTILWCSLLSGAMQPSRSCCSSKWFNYSSPEATAAYFTVCRQNYNYALKHQSMMISNIWDTIVWLYTQVLDSAPDNKQQRASMEMSPDSQMWKNCHLSGLCLCWRQGTYSMIERIWIQGYHQLTVTAILDNAYLCSRSMLIVSKWQLKSQYEK